MRYLMLKAGDREALLEHLASMPRFLADCFRDLSVEAASTPGPAGSFSPVEHCWHLADLEAEGFGVRIGRLRDEVMPQMPDFDGDRVAAERQYRKKSLLAGIEAFRNAREASLRAIREIGPLEWERPGVQEGVGAIMLCDLPHMMVEHDEAHRVEIQNWLRTRA